MRRRKRKVLPCTFTSVEGEALRIADIRMLMGGAYKLKDHKGDIVNMGSVYLITLDPRDSKKPLFKKLKEASKNWNRYATQKPQGQALFLGKLEGEIDYSIDIEPVMENVMLLTGRSVNIDKRFLPKVKGSLEVQAVGMDNLTFIKLLDLKRKGI